MLNLWQLLPLAAFARQARPTMGLVVYDQQGHATGGPRRKVDLLLTSLARQNLSSMYRALQRMEHYWAGISFVLSVLNQKAKGELSIV